MEIGTLGQFSIDANPGGPDVVDNQPLDDPYVVSPDEFRVTAILLEIVIPGELPLVFSGGTPRAVYVMLR